MLVPQMCLWGSLMSSQTDDEGELRALKQSSAQSQVCGDFLLQQREREREGERELGQG